MGYVRIAYMILYVGEKGRKQLLHTILINIINYYDKNGKTAHDNHTDSKT